jgi:DNA modification methylase
MRELVTDHRIVIADARELRGIADASVHLVVTSPPYPMIEMWDDLFTALSPAVGASFASRAFDAAFEHMHAELDRAWVECHRVLAAGGLACINVGDATRTVGGDFRLFANHARVISGMSRAGFTTLPDILWRKPTNAPNKFMGSGMLPAGAYVTYEHEYVLIFRKGPKRTFATPEEKASRRRSAFFWEERNVWFSDVWTDLVGARQDGADVETRSRSGAFPFELPYRLIQMFSLYGDTVLDPFAGTGTTLAAALASGRNSIGVEQDGGLAPAIESTLLSAPEVGRRRGAERLGAHREFVEARRAAGRVPEHVNRSLGFPVVTSQETDLVVFEALDARAYGPGRVSATHRSLGTDVAESPRPEPPALARPSPPTPEASVQGHLF